MTNGGQGGDGRYSSPWAFRAVALTLILASIIFAIIVFVNPTAAVDQLGALFTLFGSLIGSYFGIKTSNDSNDKARAEVKTAHDNEKRALAALPPDEAQAVLQSES